MKSGRSSLSKAHGARCLVIDPVSTWSKSGNELTAHGVAERLIDWLKAVGTTLHQPAEHASWHRSRPDVLTA